MDRRAGDYAEFFQITKELARRVHNIAYVGTRARKRNQFNFVSFIFVYAFVCVSQKNPLINI